MSSTGSVSPSATRARSAKLLPSFSYLDLHIWSFILPFGSIAGSIIISMIFHYADVTSTHCRVHNWLPTISAAVGNNAPEKYLFRFGIGLYTTIKLIIDITSYTMLGALREHKKIKHGKLPSSDATFNFWNRASLVLVILEDLCLVTLTMISSSDDVDIHTGSFSGFMIFAHLHFIAGLFANKYARTPFSDEERIWYRCRIFFALGHVTAFASAVYLYWRHNEYCEPGIYSLFALCEYTIVAMNICFHGMSLFEWRHLKYVIKDHNLVGKDE